MVKKFIIILFLLAINLISYSQTAFVIYNDGLTNNVLETGLTATILGGYVSQTKTVDGTIDNQSIIELTGNWANNNTNSTNVFSTSAGTTKFIGTTEQTISGTDSTQFYNVEINNTTVSGGVTVSKIAEIENSLTLTDGVVTTTSSSPLVMKTGSSSSSGSDASHVDGPMRKEGTTAFVFPLGNGGVWARLAIGTPSLSTTFEAQYFFSGYSNTISMAASPTPVLNNVSTLEYWNLTRYVGIGTATVNLYWENATRSDISSCPDLKLASWNGGGWENTYNTSGTGVCSGMGAGTISSSIAATSFVGPLTFGSLLSGAVNPLPIELLSFDAKLNDKVVDLSWSTATEINNDYFTIERSSDAINFDKVLDKPGAGNSNQIIQYIDVDRKPLPEVSYYRLKQTDFDGQFSYSDIVAVKNILDKNAISIYPNPLGTEKLNIYLQGVLDNEYLRIVILDGLGRQMYARGIITETTVNNGMLISINKKLSKGSYIVRVISSNNLYSQKLIVN